MFFDMLKHLYELLDSHEFYTELIQPDYPTNRLVLLYYDLHGYRVHMCSHFFHYAICRYFTTLD
jgi:hypothetical protein